jgi:hypothetical protein
VYDPVAVIAVQVFVPLAGNAVLAHVVPSLVSTLPVVPGATAWSADVPLPNSTLLAVRVVAPVPPAATGRVPAVNPEDEVEYSALFAAVSVVKPVPPPATLNVPKPGADVPLLTNA